MPLPERALDPVARRMLEGGHAALASVRVLAAATVHGLPGRVRFSDTFLGFAFACSGSGEVLVRALREAPGKVVELMVHPGRPDPAALTPFGRAPLREREREVLCSPGFADAVREAGFEPRAVGDYLSRSSASGPSKV